MANKTSTIKKHFRNSGQDPKVSSKNMQQKIRRPNGTGSIYFSKGHNRWVSKYIVGHDSNGKAIYKIFYGKTRKEVSALLYTFNGDISSYKNIDIENSASVADLIESWLLKINQGQVSSTVFYLRLQYFKNHIKPYLNNIKMLEFQPIHIQTIINSLYNQNYAPETIRKAKIILSAFCEFAIDMGWINKNYCNGIKISKKSISQDQTKTYKALTQEQRKTLIETLNNLNPYSFLRMLLLLLMYSGMRIGEALSLKWKDIDFDKKIIYINTSLTYEPKIDKNGMLKNRKLIIGQTKTGVKRIVPIIDKLNDEFKIYKNYLKECEIFDNIDYLNNNMFVFTNKFGGVRTYSTCRKVFDTFKRNYKFEENITFHSLRHTYSTILLESGVNPKIVQALLGHKSVKTTLIHYNSINFDNIRLTVDKFNNQINKVIDNDENLKTQKKIKKESTPFDKYTNEEINSMFKILLKERYKRERKYEE